MFTLHFIINIKYSFNFFEMSDVPPTNFCHVKKIFYSIDEFPGVHFPLRNKISSASNMHENYYIFFFTLKLNLIYTMNNNSNIIQQKRILYVVRMKIFFCICYFFKAHFVCLCRNVYSLSFFLTNFCLLKQI